jgi:hypothetical protein
MSGTEIDYSKRDPLTAGRFLLNFYIKLTEIQHITARDMVK